MKTFQVVVFLNIQRLFSSSGSDDDAAVHGIALLYFAVCKCDNKYIVAFCLALQVRDAFFYKQAFAPIV